MLTPFKRPAVIGVACTLFFLPLAEAQLNISTARVAGLGEAWGYAIGQTMRLDRIERDHPNLKRDASLARITFHQAFPQLERNIEQMFEASGTTAEALAALKEESKGLIAAEMEKEPIDAQSAALFVEEVMGRAKGVGVPEEVLQHMLAASFMERPEAELNSGWQQSFSSKNHPKSRGVTVLLKLPRSWKGTEGDRPHVVRIWNSVGGDGLDSALLMITAHEKGSVPLSRREIDRDIAMGAGSDILKSLAPAKVLSLKGFSQELAHGYMAETLSRTERAGVELSILSRIHMLFTKRGNVTLMCGVAARREQEVALEKKMKRLSESCRLIVNSLVLPGQYAGGD